LTGATGAGFAGGVTEALAEAGALVRSVVADSLVDFTDAAVRFGGEVDFRFIINDRVRGRAA
jgi:hypothetical protein